MIGAVSLTLACDPDYPSTGFRCRPSDGASACPDSKDYLCCSDDPAALDLNDLEAYVLPNYQNSNGTGTPLFSASANNLGTSGMCIESGTVPSDAAILTGAIGCPMPCNPTWGDSDISAVCGEGAVCCQTIELEPEDCALDPALGDNGCYRPVTGNDITNFGGLNVSTWLTTDHATHQDPLGKGCKTFVAATTLPDGVSESAVEEACYRRLSVADQRGFCLGATACPLDNPGYVDACDELNIANGLSGC
nr:hypothetical protein [Pseudenhygromyxa sp. WMMC2535]